MPQATASLREEWQDDWTAISHLENIGFKLTRQWQWIPPSKYVMTPKDCRAVQYLIQEWDFGGLTTG